ncbi:hypothetical protein CTL2C_330 [Chlamydia trachomatis L2c]|nr:hypothetical protein CTL2C_330 [Chlamydia trachomatis L2c]
MKKKSLKLDILRKVSKIMHENFDKRLEVLLEGLALTRRSL